MKEALDTLFKCGQWVAYASNFLWNPEYCGITPSSDLRRTS